MGDERGHVPTLDEFHREEADAVQNGVLADDHLACIQDLAQLHRALAGGTAGLLEGLFGKDLVHVLLFDHKVLVGRRSFARYTSPIPPVPRGR